MAAIENNRIFTLSPLYLRTCPCWAYNEKEETSFEISSCEMECGGRDSNSHRITPTTPSK